MILETLLKQILLPIAIAVISTLITNKLINENDKKSIYSRLIKDHHKRLSMVHRDLNNHHLRYLDENKQWKLNPNQGINPSVKLEIPYLSSNLESFDDAIAELAKFNGSDEIISDLRKILSNLTETYNSFLKAFEGERTRHHYFQFENQKILSDYNQQLLDESDKLLKKIDKVFKH